MRPGLTPAQQKAFREGALLFTKTFGPADGLGPRYNGSRNTPSEARTAPLWGLRFRTRFLHDLRGTSVDEAIRDHGGDSEPLRDRFVALSKSDHAALMRFLATL